jgi:hypothetical protein
MCEPVFFKTVAQYAREIFDGSRSNAGPSERRIERRAAYRNYVRAGVPSSSCEETLRVSARTIRSTALRPAVTHVMSDIAVAQTPERDDHGPH